MTIEIGDLIENLVALKVPLNGNVPISDVKGLPTGSVTYTNYSSNLILTQAYKYVSIAFQAPESSQIRMPPISDYLDGYGTLIYCSGYILPTGIYDNAGTTTVVSSFAIGDLIYVYRNGSNWAYRKIITTINGQTNSIVTIPVYPKFSVLTANHTVDPSEMGTIFLCENTLTVAFTATTDYTADFWCGVINYSNSASTIVTVSSPDQIGFGGFTQLVLAETQGCKFVNQGTAWGIYDNTNLGGTFTNIFNITLDTVTINRVHNKGFLRLSTGTNAKTVTLTDNATDPSRPGFDCEVYNPSTTAFATIVASPSGTIEGINEIGPLQSVRIIKRSYGTGAANVWVVRGVPATKYFTTTITGATTFTQPYTYVSFSAIAGASIKICNTTLYALNAEITVNNTSNVSCPIYASDGTTLITTVGGYQVARLIVRDNSNSVGTFDSYVVSNIATGYVQGSRPINAQTGTTYTLVLTDAGKMVTMTNASASTLTIPPNSSVAFPVATEIDVAQLGAGQITFTPGAGVTLISYLSLVHTAGQYATATLKQTTTDTWLLMGNII